MVSSRGKFARAPAKPVEVIFAEINGVKLNMVFDVCADGMNVQSAKVLSKFLLLLWANVFKVLVAEDYHASLCNQQGQLVFLGIAQLRELQACDLGADSGR